MLSVSKRLEKLLSPTISSFTRHLQHYRTDAVSTPHRRRSRKKPNPLKKLDDKSEWWAIDGEMHELGENVPPRERFVIPRDNIPNKRRKQLRDQFMRRTRLVLKESEHEPWCKRYLELYQELRENWERLYWDEGYSKKLAQDHANYESAEDDDSDFSPYRRKHPHMEEMKLQGHGLGRNRQDDTWDKVDRIRDKFEYDREMRMREKAFAPMSGGMPSHDPNSRSRPLDAERYFSQTERGHLS